MSIAGGTMRYIYGTMSIVDGTISIDGGTMRISGGTMSNGRKVVEPCKEPWTKFIVNEHFKGGTMKNIIETMVNFDGTMKNAGGIMCI